MNRVMELDIWKGDWGLASVDFDCLRLVTYCKFAGVPLQLNVKNHTLKTPKGRLPVFRHYKRTLSTFEEVSSYLTKKNLSPDFGLSEKQKADVVAFTMYLKEHLYPALLHVWWVDERNYMNVTRKWFAKTLPFPLGMVLPDRYQKAAHSTVEALFQHIEDERAIETEVYARAERCLSAVSHRLGSQEFMLGPHPCSVDATLYTYLAPLVKVPFPNTKLKDLITGHSNLLKYVTRISQRYFAAETQAYEAQRLQEQSSTSAGGEADSFPNRRRNQFLAAGFAIVAMAMYGFSTGLLQVAEAGPHGSVRSLVETDDDDN